MSPTLMLTRSRFKNRPKFGLINKRKLVYSFILSNLISILILVSKTTWCFYIDSKQSPNLNEWSYAKQSDWPLEYKQCSLKAQSPIDIQRKYVIPNNQLRLHFYNYNQLTRFQISNAHHTIKLNPIYESHSNSANSFGVKLTNSDSSHKQQASGNNSNNNGSNFSSNQNSDASDGGEMFDVDVEIESTDKSKVIVHEQNGKPPLSENGLDSEPQQQQQLPYNGAPTIKLDWLDDGNNEFKLRDIHFHWAERRDNGSEHAIDGRRAAMEMHLVHVKHGLDKSKIAITSDSIAVIAILIESYRKSNADFNPIVNALTRINTTEQHQEIEYKSINDLLPNILTSFYTYSGSLTTPPCYQVVNWIVMSDRLYMNAKQLEMFRNLYAPTDPESSSHHYHDDHSGHQSAHLISEPTIIMPNIRQLQPLNNRTILASFSPFGKLEQAQSENDLHSGGGSSAYHSSSSYEGIFMLVATISLTMSIIPNNNQQDLQVEDLKRRLLLNGAARSKLPSDDDLIVIERLPPTLFATTKLSPLKRNNRALRRLGAPPEATATTMEPEVRLFNLEPFKLRTPFRRITELFDIDLILSLRLSDACCCCRANCLVIRRGIVSCSSTTDESSSDGWPLERLDFTFEQVNIGFVLDGLQSARPAPLEIEEL